MARKLRPDEREAQNRQLPATVKLNIGGKSLKGSRDDLSRTPLGSPPVDYDVRSIFDVRPVGGFDFNISTFDTINEGITPYLVEMTVPEGFVAVLRDIDVWFEPAPAGLDKSDFTWTLMLNGAAYNYNVDIPFGTAVDRELVFMLADEFNRIGVRVVSTGGSYGTERAYARFHGTFLPKTARPLPFEIANPTRQKQDRRVAPPVPKKEVSAPRVIAPAVIPATPAVERPPFPISWRAARGAFTRGASTSATTGPQAIPMQNDRGQRRDLTREEIARYSVFLNSVWPGRDGRPL